MKVPLSKSGVVCKHHREFESLPLRQFNQCYQMANAPEQPDTIVIKGVDRLPPGDYRRLLKLIGRLGLSATGPNNENLISKRDAIAELVKNVNFAFGKRLRDVEEWRAFAIAAGYKQNTATRIFWAFVRGKYPMHEVAIHNPEAYERLELPRPHRGVVVAKTPDATAYIDVHTLETMTKFWVEHPREVPEGIGETGLEFLENYVHFATQYGQPVESES